MASWQSLVYRFADLTLTGSTFITSTLAAFGPTPRVQNRCDNLHTTAEHSEAEEFQAALSSSTTGFDGHRFLVPGALADSGDQTESNEASETYLTPISLSPITPLSPVHSCTQLFAPLEETHADDASVVSSNYECKQDHASLVITDNENESGDHLLPIHDDPAPVAHAPRARTKGKSVWRPAQPVPQFPRKTTLPYIEFPSQETLSKRAARRLKVKKRKDPGKDLDENRWLESQSNSQESGIDPTPGSSTNTGIPLPEQLTLGERALDIYEKKYTNNEKPRRPPRPPPTTPHFTPNTFPTPSSSPLSSGWRQRAAERTTSLPMGPNVYSPNWDPSPPSPDEYPSIYESPRWRRSSRPEPTHQVNYNTWSSVATAHRERWGLPVHREIVNYSPCLICFDIPRQFPALRASSSCTHKSNVCASCLEQHIAYAVQSQGSTAVACPDPDCRREMEYGDVLRGARNNQQCIDRYETLLLRRTLAKEPNFIWCKNPACEWGQVHESGAAAPIVTCRYCRSRSCFTHNLPWHTGLTCEQYDARRAAEIEVENDASQTYIEQHSKRCPSCNRPIEKTEGCDHMTCDARFGCGHEFCWICLANYEPIIQDGNHRHNADCQYYRPLPDLATHRTFEEYFRQRILEMEGFGHVEVEADDDFRPEWE